MYLTVTTRLALAHTYTLYACLVLLWYVMLTQEQDKTRATEDDVKEQERIANSLEAELNSYKVQHTTGNTYYSVVILL
jgi:hypothetical protein